MKEVNVVTKLSDDNMTFTVAVNGDFGFSLLHEFRNAYSRNDASLAKNVVIDMRMTDTVDSSALGMLLNMKQYMNKADGEIHIINCNKFVSKIFDITNFKKKFTIDFL